MAKKTSKSKAVQKESDEKPEVSDAEVMATVYKPLAPAAPKKRRAEKLKIDDTLLNGFIAEIKHTLDKYTDEMMALHPEWPSFAAGQVKNRFRFMLSTQLPSNMKERMRRGTKRGPTGKPKQRSAK